MAPDRFSPFVALLILLVLGSPVAAACTAGTAVGGGGESTPNADFADGGNGTVIHLKTGLVWKRCLEGQEWTGSGCTGEPYQVLWAEALQIAAYSGGYAGFDDWRVPNRKELESIVEFCGHSPAINQFQFPPMPAERLWSSTTSTEVPDLAWDVYFSDGYSGLSRKSPTLSYVRLVRTAEPDSLLTPQQITFGAVPSIAVGGSGTLIASSSAGLPVTLTSLTAGVCAVAGFAVSGLTEGSCTIAANQSGNASVYPAAQVTATLNIGRLPQAISFGSVGNLAVGAYVNLTVSASSGLDVELTTSTPSVCTLAGSALTTLSNGYCTVSATQSGNASYRPAVPASISIEVGDVSGGGGGDPLPGMTYGQNLGAGWHLLGNSLNGPIDVQGRFGDALKIESVWAWRAEERVWAFHSPLLSPAQLQAYLASKSFQPLTSLPPGMAYWLKLKQSHDFGEQTGEPFVLGSSALSPGWNLVTAGEEITPAELNVALAATPPGPGVVPQSFVSLWAWDQTRGLWYFYSPVLDAQGPTKVKEYADQRGYLDFATEQKKIGKGIGFWIRK